MINLDEVIDNVIDLYPRPHTMAIILFEPPNAIVECWPSERLANQRLTAIMSELFTGNFGDDEFQADFNKALEMDSFTISIEPEE